MVVQRIPPNEGSSKPVPIAGWLLVWILLTIVLGYFGGWIAAAISCSRASGDFCGYGGLVGIFLAPPVALVIVIAGAVKDRRKHRGPPA